MISDRSRIALQNNDSIARIKPAMRPGSVIFDFIVSIFSRKKR